MREQSNRGEVGPHAPSSRLASDGRRQTRTRSWPSVVNHPLLPRRRRFGTQLTGDDGCATLAFARAAIIHVLARPAASRFRTRVCACPFVPLVVWSSPAKVRIGITLRVAVAAPEPKKVGVPFSLNEYTGRADTLSDPMGKSWPYDLSGVAASPRGIRLWPGRRSTRSRTPASQPTRLIRRKRLGPDSYCSPRRVRRCSTRCDERAEEGSTE